jgi:HAT1-interacting factor 1
MADTNVQTPTTAVEAAVAPETDISAAPSTTGTATLVDDIAMAASSLTANSAPGTGTATPQPGTGTATPFIELDENQRRMSLNVSLADLSAKATALYAKKNYEEAAEVYAQAAEFQAEMNGEMNPENAEILFLYGRALFKVGQSKSDVLGGKAPAEEGAKKPKKGKKSGGGKTEADAKPGESVEKAVEDKVATIAEEATEAKKTEESAEKKPLFQFTGDENFDESDEEVGRSDQSW